MFNLSLNSLFRWVSDRWIPGVLCGVWVDTGADGDGIPSLRQCNSQTRTRSWISLLRPLRVLCTPLYFSPEGGFWGFFLALHDSLHFTVVQITKVRFTQPWSQIQPRCVKYPGLLPQNANYYVISGWKDGSYKTRETRSWVRKESKESVRKYALVFWCGSIVVSAPERTDRLKCLHSTHRPHTSGSGC